MFHRNACEPCARKHERIEALIASNPERVGIGQYPTRGAAVEKAIYDLSEAIDRHELETLEAQIAATEARFRAEGLVERYDPIERDYYWVRP